MTCQPAACRNQRAETFYCQQPSANALFDLIDPSTNRMINAERAAQLLSRQDFAPVIRAQRYHRRYPKHSHWSSTCGKLLFLPNRDARSSTHVLERRFVPITPSSCCWSFGFDARISAVFPFMSAILRCGISQYHYCDTCQVREASVLGLHRHSSPNPARLVREGGGPTRS